MERLNSDQTDSTSTNDNRFIFFLNEFIEQELDLLEENSYSFNNKEKYLIFREAFSKVTYFSLVLLFLANYCLIYYFYTDYRLCASLQKHSGKH